MSSYKYLFVVFSITLLGAFGVLFYSNINETTANKHEYWVTINKSELDLVEKELPNTKFSVKRIDDGIALVHISNGDLERLSQEMHKHFNKCSGFISHSSENDALRFIAKTQQANGFAKLGNYIIDNQASVLQLISQTQEPLVRQMIIDLSSFETRRHDQPAAQESAQFIKDKWTELANSRSDISVEFFNHPTSVTPQPSVILTINGTVSPDEIIVLGGHQDSIISGPATSAAPGADDDASGIASLTEAIRVLSESGFRPEKTVKFMAYAAEEVGLRGSADIAQTYASNNLNVIGVLQLDMTNFQGDPNIDIAFESDSNFTNIPQTAFLKELVDEYLPNLNYTDFQCNYGCSDHAAWHNEGFPASFPFEAPFGQHNNKIHTPNDKIEESNGTATHAEKFTKLALTFVGELAKGSIQTTAPNNKTKFDFDGDNKTDPSIFRPNAGEWWYQRSSDGNDNAFQFGNSSDVLVPADYTGDGKTDIAFWRDSNEVFVLRSDDFTFFSFPFGIAGDIHAPGDFDGDGIDDVAVFRPSNSTWYISRSSDSQFDIIPFGVAGDQPVIADYDGDGMDDIAIYRPTNSQWWINRSTDGVLVYQFGQAGDQAVPGDYTGDGKMDVAFFRPSSNEWFVIRSEDSSFYSFPFGSNGDIPVPGDYDGDGSFDAAIYRESDNTWYKLQSTNGFEAVGFGSAGDFPIPNKYVVE